MNLYATQHRPQPWLPEAVERLIVEGELALVTERLEKMELKAMAFGVFRDNIRASLPAELHDYIDHREEMFLADALHHTIAIRIPGCAAIYGTWSRDSVESRIWQQCNYDGSRAGIFSFHAQPTEAQTPQPPVRQRRWYIIASDKVRTAFVPTLVNALYIAARELNDASSTATVDPVGISPVVLASDKRAALRLAFESFAAQAENQRGSTPPSNQILKDGPTRETLRDYLERTLGSLTEHVLAIRNLLEYQRQVRLGIQPAMPTPTSPNVQPQTDPVVQSVNGGNGIHNHHTISTTTGICPSNIACNLDACVIAQQDEAA